MSRCAAPLFLFGLLGLQSALFKVRSCAIMAEPLNCNSSFQNECKFYSDQEYEKFLKNIKRNLQLLEIKSDQVRPEAKSSFNSKTEYSFDTMPESLREPRRVDLSHTKANNFSPAKAECYINKNDKIVSNDEDENFSDPFVKKLSNLPNSSETKKSVVFGENDSDSEFSNFISGLKNVLDEPVDESPLKSSDSSDEMTDDSEEEESVFEKFLTEVNKMRNNVKTSQVLKLKNSMPQRSQSLSLQRNSTDQASSNRSQSASRSPEFNLSEAKVQAEHDFMSRRRFYANQMYQFFNRKVFSNKLPENLIIKWNGKLKSTAGYCKCRRTNNDYSCHIELSPAVLISFERLQDTLIHEMCHAACWMINHSRDSHGPLWKTWAGRCNMILPQINVPTRCHSYELSYAYVLKCTNCTFERKRHKMCEKLQRTKCPICKAPTELKRI